MNVCISNKKSQNTGPAQRCVTSKARQTMQSGQTHQFARRSTRTTRTTTTTITTTTTRTTASTSSSTSTSTTTTTTTTSSTSAISQRRHTHWIRCIYLICCVLNTSPLLLISQPWILTTFRATKRNLALCSWYKRFFWTFSKYHPTSELLTTSNEPAACELETNQPCWRSILCLNFCQTESAFEAPRQPSGFWSFHWFEKNLSAEMTS